MAYNSNISFPSAPSEYAADSTPSKKDWNGIWAVWDLVTRKMLPEEELLSKPINLRNACIFYLGHIPTFLDIHLSRATGESSPKLKEYRTIFERGIDPDVDNPNLCHDHSEIPETWPPVADILAYQMEVRQKVITLIDSGSANGSEAIRKAIWIGFEHEAMDLETLLYMLVQSERTVPPLGIMVPDFVALAEEAKAQEVSNEWVPIPSRTVSLGMDNADKTSRNNGHHGWDNEFPCREVQVGEFEAKERPITNRELAVYLESNIDRGLPASWILTGSSSSKHTNGVSNGSLANEFIANKAIRTVFGQVPLQYALDWPAMASYDELAGCAAWMGGRIPTTEEARSIYDYSEYLNAKEYGTRSENIPAVNSHLLNEGVEETPPPSDNQSRSSSLAASPFLDNRSLFIDLKDENVGFKSWHPVPITGCHRLAGQAGMGGVWEWTSSVLERHEGFEPMELYPGYTGMSTRSKYACSGC
jgi:formylglycine-generating enzyme required for sulfatase activity